MKFKEDEAFENYQKDPTEREIFNSQLLKINEFDQDFKHKTEQLLLIENRIQKEILTLSKIQNPSILSVFPPNFLKTNQISNIQEEFYKSFCNPYIDNNINLDQNVNNIKLDSDNNYNYPFENSQEGNNNILFQSQIHNEIAIHNNNNNNNNNNENQLFNNNYNNEQLIYPANYSPFTNNNNNNNNNEIAIHNNENQLFNNNQLPNNNQIQKSDFVSFTNLDNLMSILDKKNEEIQNNLNATLQEKELVIQNEINSFSSMVENESKKIKIGGIFIGSFLALSFIIYISINESKKKKKPISKST